MSASARLAEAKFRNHLASTHDLHGYSRRSVCPGCRRSVDRARLSGRSVVKKGRVPLVIADEPVPMDKDTRPDLAKVMDLLVDAVCVVDGNGRYVFVSAAFQRIFGYSLDELIGTNMIDLVVPEDRPKTLRAVEEIMQGRHKAHFENRYRRKDGRIIHIMWSARWSATDGLRFAVARDITELKRAERLQRALYQISEAAHTADGLFELYQNIHLIIGDLLAAQNFFVASYDDTNDVISFPYAVNERGRVPEPQPLGFDTPLARVIRTAEPMLTSTHIIEPPDDPLGGEASNWLGVPLISQKGVIGALVAQSYSEGVCFSDEDLNLLQFVSTQIAFAIERKQAEARLRHMAWHDALTDLPNRTLFQDRVDTALKRAHRDNEHLALLYLDLDGFKQVNDTFGHEVGDLLLRDVARRLAGCIRESDTIGRMGGDEFTVLVTNIQGPDSAAIVAGKIRNAIEAPFELNGRTVNVSATIGSAVYPEHGTDRETLFRHADARMYAGKRNGG